MFPIPCSFPPPLAEVCQGILQRLPWLVKLLVILTLLSAILFGWHYSSWSD